MSDIAYWKDEYTKEVDSIGELIATLKDSKTKDKIYTEFDSKVNKLKDIKKSYGLEIRLLKDKSERSKYEAEGKELEKRINDYSEEIKQSKLEAQKDSLMKGATGAFGVGTGKDFKNNIFNTEGKGNDELLNGAMKIQDKTFDATSRSQNDIQYKLLNIKSFITTN